MKLKNKNHSGIHHDHSYASASVCRHFVWIQPVTGAESAGSD